MPIASDRLHVLHESLCELLDRAYIIAYVLRTLSGLCAGRGIALHRGCEQESREQQCGGRMDYRRENGYEEGYA